MAAIAAYNQGQTNVLRWFIQFQKEHPDVDLSKATMADLRPMFTKESLYAVLQNETRAEEAYQQGFLKKASYMALIEKKRRRLKKRGFEDLNIKGDHLLLSHNNEGAFIYGKDQLPEVHICNFELMRRVHAL